MIGPCRIVVAMLVASIALSGCPAPPETEGSASGSGGSSTGGGSAAADNSAPSTPTALAATAVSPSRVSLRWSASTDNVGVTGYRVYRNGVLLASPGNVTTYQDNSVGASTSYSYTAQALDGAGNASGQSTALILTTPASPDVTPPSAPTALRATAVSALQVNLSWSASTDNVAVTGYRVFQNGIPLVTLGNVTTYQDTSVFAAATFVYTVRALDAAGNASALSTAATATTPTGPDTAAPSTPTWRFANAVSTSQVSLSWTPSTDNVAVSGYRVYRNGVLIAILANVTTYQDNNSVVAATTYSYNLDAVDATGNASGLSAAAVVTTPVTPDTSAPTTPFALTANTVSSSQITLSWADSTDNVAVTGYRVFRNGTLVATLGNVTIYQSTGLSPATSYSYAVRAFDAAGNVSGLSASASATTQPAADNAAPSTPAGLAANTLSSSRVNLSWSASTDNVGVTGYRVYRDGVFLIAVGNVTAYQVIGLTPSTTYAFHVDAVDAAGNASGISSVANATTLAANTASLSWDAVTHPSLAGYRVYYGTASGTYLQAAGLGLNVGNVTTFMVTGLASGTRYFFAVTAFDSSSNESGYSNEVFKDIP